MSHGSGRLAGGQESHVIAEMVALLWEGGQVSLAMELEEHGAVADVRSFPCVLDSVRAARHYTAGLLEPVTDQALADDVAIAVTELAANAVVHGHSAFTVVVSRWATRIRVAVRDNAPVMGAGRESAESVPYPVPFPVTTGHGLSVVAQLASRWGVEATPAGKVVWAELGAC